MIAGFLTWSRSGFVDADFIVAGRTIGSLKRNVVAPMLAMLKAMGWAYAYNRSEGVIEVGGNRYHLFGASNEKSQDVLQGMTAAGCLADEVALFPKSFVDQMVARCSVEGSRLWFNCNPSFPTHFFKSEWIDRAAELNLLHLHFTMDDNPSLSGEDQAEVRAHGHGCVLPALHLGRGGGRGWCTRLREGASRTAEGQALQVGGASRLRYAEPSSLPPGRSTGMFGIWWTGGAGAGARRGVAEDGLRLRREVERMLGGKPERTPVVVDPSAGRSSPS